MSGLMSRFESAGLRQVTITREGAVTRIACDCGARFAGTLEYEQALLIASRHRCRRRRRREMRWVQMEMFEELK